MRIFICYEHVNIWQVKQIVKLLRDDAGYDIWFEDRLIVGQDYQAELRRMIQNAEIFVYVMSPDSVNSEWCQWQFSQAVIHNKRIMPIMIQRNTSIPLALQDRQYADLSDGITPENTIRLVRGFESLAQPVVEAATVPFSDNPSGEPAQAARTDKHVFISFSQQDKEAVVQIRDSLHRKNIATWTSDNIEPGTQVWLEEVEKAIENAGWMIIILSPSSKNSVLVRQQLSYAELHHVKIYPVLYRGKETSAVPIEVSGSQIIDLRTDFSLGISNLIRTLQSQIDQNHQSLVLDTTDLVAPATVNRKEYKLNETAWEILLTRIKQNRCTPIVGGKLCEGTIPSAEEIISWATERDYPLILPDDFAHIAQFFTFELGDLFTKEQIVDKWFLPNEPLPASHSNLSFLAQLPIPMYITTSFGNTLFHVLKQAGKEPTRITHQPDFQLAGASSTAQPTVNTPIIYHIFGHVDSPGSLIITEDDYLDFLVKIAKGQTTFPLPITSAIGKNVFLLMGFNFRDWNFRILFRTLASIYRKGFGPHIAVQMPPSNKFSSQEQERRVQDYLKKYFDQQLETHVYIGDESEFIDELKQKWENFNG